MTPVKATLALSGLIFASSAFASSTPTVSGDVITFPTTPGWYQVQRSDWSSVCQGPAGGNCSGVGAGTYIVTNLDTSARWFDVVVEPAAALPVEKAYEPPTSFKTVRLTRNAEKGTSRRHAYSRKRAFNADETRILLIESGQGVIVDLQGNTVGRTSGVREWDWHTEDPDIMFAGRGNSIVSIDTGNGNAMKTLWTMPVSGAAMIGDSEGVIAQNRYAVVTKHSSSEMYAVDLETGKTLGTSSKVSGHDWAGFTRSGKYIVVRTRIGGERVVYRYDRNFENRITLADFAEHADFFMDEAGDDWIVMLGQVTAIRVKDGKQRSLGFWKYGHISGLATDAPDWLWLSDSSKIISRSIEPGSPTIEWGRTDTNDNYASQAQVTVSPSGMRLIYTSQRSGVNEDYLVIGRR